MADVTRAEFDALTARVTALEGKTPVVTPTPTPSPTPAPLVLGAPIVTVVGSSYSLSATLSAAKAQKFTYLQLAVRGAGASDLDRRPGTKLAAGTALTLSGHGSGTGDFSAWIAYSLNGTTWVDGPKTTFTITAITPDPNTPVPTPDPGHAPGLVGKSGLGFNSLVFRQGTNDANSFGARRGAPMDGLLMFKGRSSWGDFRAQPQGHQDYLAEGRIVVTSMPHAPESEGSAMNNKGANDAYKDEQRALGKWLADNGYNKPTHYIRVDWECNGNWYNWSADRPGGADALKQAIVNYITNLRAGGATQVKFDLCFNKGPSQTGHDFDIFPGAEYVDDIGIDQYDMWNPAYSPQDWEQEMAKGPSIRKAAEFAKTHGITWSWDEGGNTHGSGGAYGGDNPTYWQLVHDEIFRNIDTCAWHNTYDDRGAPATLAHDFDQNPLSWVAYKRLWTPR